MCQQDQTLFSHPCFTSNTCQTVKVMFPPKSPLLKVLTMSQCYVGYGCKAINLAAGEISSAICEGPKGRGEPLKFKGVGKCPSDIHHLNWSDIFG